MLVACGLRAVLDGLIGSLRGQYCGPSSTFKSYLVIRCLEPVAGLSSGCARADENLALKWALAL